MEDLAIPARSPEDLGGASTRPAKAGVTLFGSITLDSSVFSANGVATAIYNNDEIGAQGGGGTRGTGKF